MDNLFFQSLRKLSVTRLIICLTIFLISYNAKSQGPPKTLYQTAIKQFNYVIGHSAFIFLGTIVYKDSSNINANIHGPKAIVRVDSVIDASKSDRKLMGKEITVIFATNAPHKKGDKAVFYTNGWSYGKTVGVIEVKNNLKEKFTPGFQQKIKQAREQIVDDSLRSELKRASFVARCIITRVNDSINNSIFQRSEHNPLFRTAMFEVKEALKGKIKNDTLSAYYASSYDPIWIDAPKLTKNVEAVFLFNKSQLPPFLKISGFTLLDPRDVQPASEVDKIKELLKNLH